MPWQITWSKEAIRELSKLDKKEAKRITNKLEQASENPLHYFSRPTGREDYKLRIGNYRAIVLILHQEKTIFVQNIGHRKNIYKKLNR